MRGLGRVQDKQSFHTRSQSDSCLSLQHVFEKTKETHTLTDTLDVTAHPQRNSTQHLVSSKVVFLLDTQTWQWFQLCVLLWKSHAMTQHVSCTLCAPLPRVQVVLSFHACGGNVGDTIQVPLPGWVLQVRCRMQDLIQAQDRSLLALFQRCRHTITCQTCTHAIFMNHSTQGAARCRLRW